jgi:hypothetical protein
MLRKAKGKLTQRSTSKWEALRIPRASYLKKGAKAKILLPANLPSGVGGESNALCLLLFSSYLSSWLISSIQCADCYPAALVVVALTVAVDTAIPVIVALTVVVDVAVFSVGGTRSVARPVHVQLYGGRVHDVPLIG